MNSSLLNFVLNNIPENLGSKTENDIEIKYSSDTEYDISKSYIENMYKCLYFYKGELIASQYNCIPTTEEGIKICLDNLNGHIKQIYHQHAYEGTTIVVYYINDKWNISTRRCINAHDSIWNPDAPSHGEIAENCIKFDELNKDLVYHYNLVAYNNRYILDYTDTFGKDYIKLIPIMATNKDLTINIEETKRFAELIEYYNASNFVKEYSEIKTLMNKSGFNKGEMYTIITDENLIFNINIQPEIYNKVYLEVGRCHAYNVSDLIIKILIYLKQIEVNDDKYFKQYALDKETFFKYKMMFNIIAVFLKDYYFIRKSKKYSKPELFEDIPVCYKVLLHNIHHILYKEKNISITYQSIYKYMMTLPAHDLVCFIINFYKIVAIYEMHLQKCNHFVENATNSLKQWYSKDKVEDCIKEIKEFAKIYISQQYSFNEM